MLSVACGQHSSERPVPGRAFADPGWNQPPRAIAPATVAALRECWRTSLSGSEGLGKAASEREFERMVAVHLTGREIPSVEVGTFDGGSVDLRRAVACRAVVYVYPGSPASPDGGRGSRVDDAVQHCVFRDAEPDLAAHRLTVVGLSSKEMVEQHLEGLNSGVAHGLLSDPGLSLATELGLPTFDLDGTRWYRRLMLVVRDECVRKVFFPVPCAERSAAQVLLWVRARGL